MRTSNYGCIIALDGVDGAGKDTQLDRLGQYLQHMPTGTVFAGKNVTRVKAPYDQGISGVLRRLALGQPVIGYTTKWPGTLQNNPDYSEGHLHLTTPGTIVGDVPSAFVSRWVLFTEYLNTYFTITEPALNRGDIVLMNRSHFLSNYAYGYAMGVAVEDLDVLVALQERYTPYPDLAIILDIPVGEAKRRLARRGDAGGEINHYDTVDDATFLSRQAAYHTLAQRWPNWVRVVDASGTPDEVWLRIKECFDTFVFTTKS